MAKPLVDWLFLRGHVLPSKLAWQPGGKPSARGHSKSAARPSCSLDKTLATLRLCMGIGDGAMRTQ